MAGYLANIPRDLSKWDALLRPYKLTVWLILIATLILSGEKARPFNFQKT